MRNHVPHLAGSASRQRPDATASTGAGHRAGWQTGGVASEGPEARTGAQAVERAMAIMSCFDADVDDLGLGEIADRSGLQGQHRPPDRAGARPRWVPGPGQPDRALPPRARLALLGQTAIARYGLDLAQPHLENLARATGEAASLGVRNGGDVVVVLRAESAQPLRFDRPHGARVPLHASAMGKALLAFGPADPGAGGGRAGAARAVHAPHAHRPRPRQPTWRPPATGATP